MMGIHAPLSLSVQKNTLAPGPVLPKPIKRPKMQRDILMIQASHRKPAQKPIPANPQAAPDGPILAIVDDHQKGRVPAFVKPKTLLNLLRLEAPINGYIPHGKVVEANAKLIAPNLRIHRVQVPNNPFQNGGWNVKTALKQLKKDLDAGLEIDAVNMSFGTSIPIERLRQDLKLPELTAQNIHKYRTHILKNFDRIQFRSDLEIATLGLVDRGNVKRYVKETIDLVEQIAERKPVYLAAGNDGPNYVNLLSLAKGVITVGAVDAKDRATPYSGNNGLITKWAKVDKRFIPVYDTEKKQLAGLTLHEADSLKKRALLAEQEPLIPMDAVQMRVLGKWWHGLKDAGIRNDVITGTSYAAPQVAAKDLQGNALLRALKSTVSAPKNGFLGLQKWFHPDN